MIDNVNRNGPEIAIREAKKALRKEKISARKNLSSEDRKAFDKCVNDALCRYLEQTDFPCLAAYLTDGTEPDLSETLQYFLSTGKPLYLPRFEAQGTYSVVRAETIHFSNSKWGIPEPDASAPEAPANDLARALWLIPGVAFDDGFHRLGRGMGIYDRLLSNGCACAAGVFYECQRSEAIPFEDHDHLLDAVVTEKGIRFRSAYINQKRDTEEGSPLTIQQAGYLYPVSH